VSVLPQALLDLNDPNIQLGLAGVDGVFGSDTASAVIAFKQGEGLQPQDGVASTETFSRLYLDQLCQYELLEL
jgi:peptidoglycan hydrolase-like protein with peptidoglycan-binding domain